MMSFGRKLREKYLVLFLLVISFLFFVYQQKINHELLKSNTVQLQHLKAINTDVQETYLRLKNYGRFIHKMVKEKTANEHKEDVNKVTNAECVTPPFLLIEIHSHPKNFLSRQAIRLSWGNKDSNAKR